MTEYPDRAAQLRAFIDGETESDPLALGEDRYLPTLTGDTVKAGGTARRIAVYDVEIGFRDNEHVPLNVASAKAGDVVLVTAEQADRLEGLNFLMGEAEYKAATKTPTRKP